MEQTEFKLKLGQLIFYFSLRDSFIEPYITTNIQKHNHISFELVYIDSGLCNFIANGVKYQVEPNNYYVVGPNVYHSQKAANQIKKIVIKFKIETNNKYDETTPVHEYELIRNVYLNLDFFVTKDDGTLLRIIEQIKHELINPIVGYYSNVCSLLSQLTIKITRDYYANKIQKCYINPTISLEYRISEIENFLLENYINRVSILDLANRLHLSKRQVERIMKKEFKMSFKQKIVQKRIELAKTLLETTDDSIKKIAEKIGYDSYQFSSIFKKKVGITPTEYRKFHLDI